MDRLSCASQKHSDLHSLDSVQGPARSGMKSSPDFDWIVLLFACCEVQGRLEICTVSSEATLISHCGQLDQVKARSTMSRQLHIWDWRKWKNFSNNKSFTKPFYGFAGSFSFVSEPLPDVTYWFLETARPLLPRPGGHDFIAVSLLIFSVGTPRMPGTDNWSNSLPTNWTRP